MTLEKLLTAMHRLKGSDVYISVGMPPAIKVHGQLQSAGKEPLSEAKVYELAKEAMSEEKYAEFIADKEANFAFNVDKVGRFRISAFFQKDQPGMVIRRIEMRIPTFEELHLPPVLKEVCMAKRGLVLFVGATGSGKSTSQAAMIGYRNMHASGHIITVEDPIEFVHQHGRSIITQREVGLDTESFEMALKNSLRQAPDVILLGEIRTRETMEFAIAFAETGHLCMATLHANNANQALDRILHLVPEDMQRQFLFDLSVNLRCVVAQQLIPTQDGNSRRGAFEIMLNTPLVGDTIRKGELHELKGIMSKSNELGMLTFDQALFNLYQQGLVGYTEALAHADSPNDLRLMIKLQGSDAMSSGLMDDVTVDM
ncbi:PilT/PilU family type 4a pilus ATPase [Motilimonas pumila]|uniref:PilT/PilU family type 4a pilus ATPase n=1 Tax=Motilimonas pumila TaxID=2303987 RepID=A0A418YAN5_9GAMM|nr:PilT/PilU family type 4a pilus ATPase [Motilimonas pumila]RJG40024.1 PilT/PilU family type 4a pilus ATPase [Motilimonas pumila]